MSCWNAVSVCIFLFFLGNIFLLVAYTGSSRCSNCNFGSDVQRLRLVAAASGSYSVLPVVLAGLLGAGVVETAYADADEVCAIYIYGHQMLISISFFFSLYYAYFLYYQF